MFTVVWAHFWILILKRKISGFLGNLQQRFKWYCVESTERIFYEFYSATQKILFKFVLKWLNDYISVKGVEIFKAKDSDTNAAAVCLGNVLKDFSFGNMKKTGLHGYVNYISVDYCWWYFGY